MNNPFGTPNSVVTATANRFPSVEMNEPAPQLQQSQQYQQQQPQYDPNQQYQQQQPQYQQQSAPSLIQQQSYNNNNQNNNNLQFQQNSSISNNSGFIPQTAYGQQLSAQVTGYQNTMGSTSGYGGLGSNGFNNGGGGAPQFQSGQSQSSYPQQQQQFTSVGYQSNLPQATSTTFLDLDPYASSNSNSNSNSNQRATPAQFQSYSQVEQRVSHPRQYVQQEKTLLMSWDDYAWKQLLSRLDSLREGWESRKQHLLELSRRGGDPTQLDHLERETTSNIDSIHASKLQLSEVQSGWRFSTDAASKARVREALNAGLASLPEYPPVLQPEQVGGAFHQRAHEEARKQNIMSGFSPQVPSYGQQNQQPMMQQQFTGYPQQQQQQYLQPQNPYPQQNQNPGFQQPQPGYFQQQQY